MNDCTNYIDTHIFQCDIYGFITKMCLLIITSIYSFKRIFNVLIV